MLISTKLHGFTSKKKVILIVTDVRTSNLAILKLFFSRSGVTRASDTLNAPTGNEKPPPPPQYKYLNFLMS
jgi:hypothetical protein